MAAVAAGARWRLRWLLSRMPAARRGEVTRELEALGDGLEVIVAAVAQDLWARGMIPALAGWQLERAAEIAAELPTSRIAAGAAAGRRSGEVRAERSAERARKAAYAMDRRRMSHAQAAAWVGLSESQIYRLVPAAEAAFFVRSQNSRERSLLSRNWDQELERPALSGAPRPGLGLWSIGAILSAEVSARDGPLRALRDPSLARASPSRPETVARSSAPPPALAGVNSAELRSAMRRERQAAEDQAVARMVARAQTLLEDSLSADGPSAGLPDD